MSTTVHENRAVAGMDCYDCARTIERAVNRVDGVVECSVNFAGARMNLEYEASAPATAAHVERVVSYLGYQLSEPLSSQRVAARALVPTAGEPWWRRRADLLVTVVAAIATVAAVVVDAAGASVAATVLYGLAVVVGGSTIARSGVRAVLATRRLDINMLMTVAVVGAVAIGAWLEAALVVVLFRIGENLERGAVDRARHSLETLMQLAPHVAHRRVDSGVTSDVLASDLAVGDLVVVRPGERIPSDGEVTEGASAVDQSAITGESMPVDKGPGSAVFAGTMNGEGMLVVSVTNEPGDSTLDRVARAVADAQAQRSPTERWVDAFARVYTPIVLGVALVVAVVPPLFNGDWSEWIYRGLAFLILACPCALVIATPVAVVAGLARASRAGVLVKGGTHLEALTTIRAVATDKTGTLTMGEPAVTDLVGCGSHRDVDALRLAAAVDAGSEHPIARAIVTAAAELEIALPSASGFEAIRGFGARAVVDGRTVTVGNDRLVADHPQFDMVEEARRALTERGRTLVFVTAGDEMIGVLGVADRIRPGAAAAMAELRRLGVAHTVLLTGDHEAAAAPIAEAANITDLRADLLPQDKVDALRKLQNEFGATAMIGDGVNDAPALAAASVGIAMGGAGSPSALETADVILMGDDLRKLPGLIALARRTKVIVRQNIGFSLTTKAVAAGFALFGLLPLWLAVMADVGATLLVVLNGLRVFSSELHPPIE